jgi:hypothetical protein
VVGVVKEQTQPLVVQGRVALQVPPHVVGLWKPFRNCRAETVPAQRTAVMIAANNVDLTIFLLMIGPFSNNTARR